jgi:hypothetical protein
VRYVDNVRPVLELQAAIHGVKRNLVPAEPGRQTKPATKPREEKNDTTQQPEQKQERNYSQTESHYMLASVPVGPTVVDPSTPDLPVVSVSTYRRFV